MCVRKRGGVKEDVGGCVFFVTPDPFILNSKMCLDARFRTSVSS